MEMDIVAHFRNLEKALETEKKEELDRYKELTENASFFDRIEAGITLYPIEFRDVTFNQFGDQVITIHKNPRQSGDAFGMGKLVELFNADGDTCDGQLIQEEERELKIRILDDDVRAWIKDGNVGLNALVDTKTYELYLSIILQVINGFKYPVLSQFYYGHAEDIVPTGYQNSRLNASQIEAVASMLSDNAVSIIHGPPGTGKTTTLVAGMKELIKRGQKILLCAPSNAAVDHVCEKLMQEDVQVVRVGNSSKATAEAQRADLDHLLLKDKSYQLIKNLKDQASKIREKAFKYKRNFGKEEYEERKRSV